MVTVHPVPHPTKRQTVQIEQAVARGWPASRIMRTYGYSYETVYAVRLGMDLACADSMCRYNPAELAAERRIVAVNRARSDWAAQVSLSHTMRAVEVSLEALLRPAGRRSAA